jgi:heme A synthase
VSLAMFTAVATSQRYTADFCPLMICGAAYGGLMVESLPQAWRRASHTVWSVLTAAAVLVTLALTVRYQGELVWGVPADVSRNYRALCARVDHLFDISPRESK